MHVNDRLAKNLEVCQEDLDEFFIEDWQIQKSKFPDTTKENLIQMRNYLYMNFPKPPTDSELK